MSYLKPQNPIKLNNDYIYPLTTADQVITGSGERLNSLFKKTIRETATLQVANWSDTKPYTQTITLNYSVDDYNVDANVAYGDGDNAALYAAAGCISYIKKNHKEITFYCLKSKPEVDIPIEITGTCRNTIATVEEGIKLNFDIKAYANEEELLADTPMENTIGVITDVNISGYKFSATEPTDMVEGEVWICTGKGSSVTFDVVEGFTICPLFAKQYVGGAWVNVTTMSYQDEEWVKWVRYLYNNGDQCVNLSGGWKGENYHSSYQLTGGNIAINNDCIVVNAIANGSIAAITNNPIDLTNCDKIRVAAKTAQGAYEIVVNKVFPADSFAAKIVTAISTTEKENSYIDVSSLTGEYYIAIASVSQGIPLYIYEVEA